MHGLYDALALDIPNLPKAVNFALNPAVILLVVLGFAALSGLLSLTGRRWVTQRSTLQLLKEGAA